MDKRSVSGSDERNGHDGGREIAEQAAVQLAKIRRAGGNVRDEISTYVKKQPVASLGIALGAGFILGSLLGSRLARIALTAAVGFAAQELLEGALGKGGVRALLVEEVSKLARGEEAPS